MRTLVKLIRDHGATRLIAAVGASEDDEEAAILVVTTAHKAKGRQWPSVRLMPDFTRTRDGVVAVDEIRLFYVAMTRAQHTLIVEPELLGQFTGQ